MRFPWLHLALVSVALSADSAAQSLAQLEKAPRTDAIVSVSGVVTAVDSRRIFVQDETGAVAVARSASTPLLAVGDACEASGTLLQDAKNLELLPQEMKKTGVAPLPAARPMKAGDAAAGRARHQRIKLTGFVHETGLAEGSVVIALQCDGLTVLLAWPAAKESPKLPLDLLDAQVEAEGVAVPQEGNLSAVSGLRLLMAGSEHLKIKRTGNADVFTRPAKTLREMRDPKLDNGERYRMKGTVTFWSDAGWFYFTDGTGHARGNSNTYLPTVIGWPYRTAEGYNPPLHPGDEIEVIAQRRNLGPAMPHLVHCQWRITGKGNPPLYEPVTVSEVVKGGLDGYAVSLICKLEETQVMRDYQSFFNHTLWATSDDQLVQVLVQLKQAKPIPFMPGDRFRAHGTVSFSQGSNSPKSAFRLNVTQLEDLALLPPPPFWQNPAMAKGIAIASAVLLFAAGWIITLRRLVKAQTAQLQAQLDHEKELSELKSRFVFTVSHEFRNPLAAIMSCSDVLQRMREKLSPAEHERQISGIQQNVRRMADMMEEVLLLGRAEAGRLPCEPQSVDVASFCLKLADQIRSASHQRCPVELRIPVDMPRLLLDPALLQHILGNLLSNAVKFSPAGESVEVTAAHCNGVAVFTVRDHGAGIPTLDRGHIFEPFQRGSNVAETPGTGLGLAITERCVRAHGGSIECESSHDEGTTFIVRIPCAAAPETSPAA